MNIAILGLSRAYQPQIGRSATLQNLTLLHVPCHLNVPTIWTISFRWVLTLYAPSILIAIPFGIHIKTKLWLKCSPPLQCYLKLFFCIVLMNLFLLIPSFIIDISSIQPLENLSNLISNSAKMNKLDFSSIVLSRIFSKLQFLYFPVGIMVILPWKSMEKRYDFVEKSFLFRQTKNLSPKKCITLENNEEIELKSMLNKSLTSDV